MIKPELFTNLWHDFNDTKPGLSLILDMFLAAEKPELLTNLWHDFNDKKLELSSMFGYVVGC